MPLHISVPEGGVLWPSAVSRRDFASPALREPGEGGQAPSKLLIRRGRWWGEAVHVNYSINGMDRLAKGPLIRRRFDCPYVESGEETVAE
jgi:hypothetical protein